MPPDSLLSKRSPELESQLAELPPSAKYVFSILWYEGKLTQQELQGATLLPRRTVSHSLKRLGEEDLIDKGVYEGDARVREYSVASSVDALCESKD